MNYLFIQISNIDVISYTASCDIIYICTHIYIVIFALCTSFAIKVCIIEGLQILPTKLHMHFPNFIRNILQHVISHFWYYLYFLCGIVWHTMHPLPPVSIHHAYNVQHTSSPGDPSSGLIVTASQRRLGVIG